MIRELATLKRNGQSRSCMCG